MVFSKRVKNGIIIGLLLVAVNVTGQIKVILDTDPSYDPDDVGCMAMLHNMASLGECEILAVINSTNHKESSLAISAINTFFHRGAIPIGDYKGYSEKIDAPDLTYDKHLAEIYPLTINSWHEALDGVKLYREVLASANPKSITVVIIGTMHNFYGLLQSQPDEFSPLTGEQLVEEKVRLVATMGGNFIDGKGLDRTNWGGSEELCSYTEWSCLNEERNRMCRYVIEHCPAPFMASGWEVGCGDYYNANYGTVFTGQGLKSLDTTHIVRRAYEYHFDKRGGAQSIQRHSNDQCALHYAIRGEGDNYSARKNGKITLSEKGECSWDEVSGGLQGYIQKKRHVDLIATEIEELMIGFSTLPDYTPPNCPHDVRTIPNHDGYRMTWEPSVDNTKGSWVVGYNIYVEDEIIKRVNGTQGTLDGNVDKDKKYYLTAVNSNGVESIPISFSL